MQVLVAEDDSATRLMVAKSLRDWGYEVVEAADGAAAWSCLQESDAIRLVVSDWSMPGLDGLELCQRVRTLPRSEYTYFILLTAHRDKESLVQGLAAGADDYVAKPFDKQELLARIRAGERTLKLQHELAERLDELTRVNRRLAEANRRMKTDLEAAARLQQALLPTELPGMPSAGFAWLYRPCEELGGDCLNVFQLDASHVGFYILDVSGHGVAAALLSVTLRRMLTPQPAESSLLHERLTPSGRRRITPPARVAEELNRLFPFDPDVGQYFTLFYGVLNTRSRLVRFVSAGHPSPIRVSGPDRSIVLDAPGYPIGITETPEYEEHVVRLQPGDRLYVYSDGLSDAANSEGNMLGAVRLQNLLGSLHGVTLENTLTELWNAVGRWSGHDKPVDDVSMLAVEINPRTELVQVDDLVQMADLAAVAEPE